MDCESDDVVDKNFLKTLMPIFEAHKSVGLCCCNSQIIDEEGKYVLLDTLSETPKEQDPRYENCFENNGRKESVDFM